MKHGITITLEDIDWELLQQQKTWLMCFDFRDDEPDFEDPDLVADRQRARGLLNLLDAIQDAAVDQAGLSEETVFGCTLKSEPPASAGGQ